jgi:hypothetical protein
MRKHSIHIILACIVLIGCSKSNTNKTNDPASNVKVGDTYQGGVVFYILKSYDIGYSADATHGLIAATIDINTSAVWGKAGVSVPITKATQIGAGKSNTQAIIAAFPNVVTYAKLCADFKFNNYNDWYLPSKDEFHQIHLNNSLIGAFYNGMYLTSTEVDANSVYGQWVISASVVTLAKNGGTYVRPIRSF